MDASIEQVNRVVGTLGEARIANQQTPTRRGNVVVITADDADDVMITADLHGHRENFLAILSIADLERNKRRHLILQEVCHGGPCYPGGGCRSHVMLEEVAALKSQYPERVHFIMSNHEMAELTDFPILKAQRLLNLAFRNGLLEAYGDFMDRVREGYLEFLRSLPLAVRLPGGVFISHSLPEEGVHQEFDTSIFDRPLTPVDFEVHGSLFNLVWGRDFRPENAQAFATLVGAEVLIHGHEPCREAFQVPNDRQIILDCSRSPASYLILPTTESLTHAQIVERIEILPADHD
jgi:hypothetical protein